MSTQTTENTKQSKKNDEKTNQSSEKITCGIIMPIATMSTEYTSEHWDDVRLIIDKAIERAGFLPRIVSDSEDSTIIHKSIINNIYNDEIIVCDVSNKNANVMFELGMRLAFNKPVVIIKDDKTGYSFDTSNIEHVGYRKDLRHNTIEKFIDELSKKIKATFEAPKKEGYQTFLSHFGKFEVAKIENRSIEGTEALEQLLNKMNSIENELRNYTNFQKTDNVYVNKYETNSLTFDLPPFYEKNDEIEILTQLIGDNIPLSDRFNYTNFPPRLTIHFLKPLGPIETIQIKDKILKLIKNNENL